MAGRMMMFQILTLAVNEMQIAYPVGAFVQTSDRLNIDSVRNGTDQRIDVFEPEY
jgi:hypothetical protein